MSQNNEKEVEQADTETDRAIAEWSEGIGATPSLRVEVYRVSPAVWRGKKVDGKIGHLDGLPELDDIKERFGGGTYRLIVKKPDENGRLLYFACRTVSISGVPVVPANARKAGAHAADGYDSLRALVKKLERRVQALERAIDEPIG